MQLCFGFYNKKLSQLKHLYIYIYNLVRYCAALNVNPRLALSLFMPVWRNLVHRALFGFSRNTIFTTVNHQCGAFESPGPTANPGLDSICSLCFWRKKIMYVVLAGVYFQIHIVYVHSKPYQ